MKWPKKLIVGFVSMFFLVSTIQFLNPGKTVNAATTLYWPVPGHRTLSQGYHDGNAIDISDGSIAGADVVAAIGGTVCTIYKCGEQHSGSNHDCNGFGTGIAIHGDDGRTYQYAHMQANSMPSYVYYGARIEANQKVGKVGTTGNSTGNHLHFAISNTQNYWEAGPNPANESYYSDPVGVSWSTYSTQEIKEGKVLLAKTASLSGATMDNVSTVGIDVYNASGSLVKSKEENPDRSGHTYVHIWYDLSSELGLSITPGTVYKYSFWVKISGKKYESSRETVTCPPVYTVKFDAQGGSSVSQMTVGKNQTISTLPTSTRSGYTLNGWFTATSGGTKLTTSTKITGNITYYAQWSKSTYSITLSSVSNGTASLSKTSAAQGTEITVTATPATGYVLDTIKVNGNAISGNKFTMPAQNTTVAVTFKKVSYTVSLSSVSNGTASLSKTSAYYGDEITVTANPSSGYTLDKITVNGTAISGNKFTMPAKNTTVAVTFKKASYTVSLGSVTNGTVSLSKTTANAGDEITVTATPASGYELDKITVNGTEISGNKFTMPAKNTTVEVTFKAKVHTLTKVAAKSPTCSETGNIAYYICKDTDCGCNKIYSDAAGQNEISLAETVIPATGHDLEKVAPKAATCTEDGHLGYWKCKKCGKMFADEEGKTPITAANVTVEALGHDADHVDYVDEKPATYKEDGHKGYYLCPRCGKKFKDPNLKVPVTDAELLIPKKGAAVQGEEATVDDLIYRVTYQATDGTGTVTLNGVDNKTASVSIPATVEIKGNTYKVVTIGPSAFAKNTVLTSVYIGSNVATVADNAFNGCTQLVKVSGGANLKSIGTRAFAGCPKLKTFVITSKVLWKIGPYAFSGDKSLKTIYIKNTTKLVKSGVKKSLKGSKVKTVKVKKSKIKKYKKYFKKSNSGRKVKVKK